LGPRLFSYGYQQIDSLNGNQLSSRIATTALHIGLPWRNSTSGRFISAGALRISELGCKLRIHIR